MSPEYSEHWELIAKGMSRLVSSLEGFSVEELNWKPLDNANSLYVLAYHTGESMRWHILSVLCRQPITRHRDEEFRVQAVDTMSALQRWETLRNEITRALEAAPVAWLDDTYAHPTWGDVSGRTILLKMNQHTGEHVGHAELTRDLLREQVRRGAVRA